MIKVKARSFAQRGQPGDTLDTHRVRLEASVRREVTGRGAGEGEVQGASPKVYEFVLVRAGVNLNGWEIAPEVLKRAAGLFAGVSSLINHASRFEGADVQAVFGAFQRVEFDAVEEALTGECVIAPTGAPLIPLLEHVLNEREAGRIPPKVGMSVDIGFTAEGKRVKEIVRVYSCDLVFDPAAGGEILRAKNSTGGEGMTNVREDGATADGAAQVSEELLLRQCANVLATSLAASDLPQAYRDAIEEEMGGRVFMAEELDKVIERHRRMFARARQDSIVQGVEPERDERNGAAHVSGMFDGLDRFQAAVDRLMGNAVPENLSDVPRLTGIKEAYILASGDREMLGRYVRERVQLANGTTTTLAGVVKNALNKRLANAWQTLASAGYDWFQKIVLEDDFDSIQQISWVNAGGFGDLPTVSEGAAYTELAWTDNTETVNFVKKGGYIGLTLEMIDRDDVAKIRGIPTALANAALRTLSAAVANILTQAGGAGPTLADSNALFSAAHGNNNGTTVLSATAWDAAIQAVYKFTQLNNARRLALRPRYLLVPVELEKTGWQVLSSNVEPATNVFYTNVRESDVKNVITCPEFTSATMWHAIVDPAVYPSLGVGYRYGRRPELFVSDQPEVGSMFTNDELRIKVRWFVGVGVIDWRGVYRGNT